MIRTIQTEEITRNIKEMCIEANHFLAEDMEHAMKKAAEEEKSELGKKILLQLQENLKIAGEEMIPICQDTGMAVFFVEIGQDVHFEGQWLEDAINEGVRQGYTEGYLRKSVVADPILRENTKDNTPAIIHYSIVPGDKVTITFAPKGFGSENMSRIFMLKPADGIDGVKNAILTAVKDAGPNACPPMVVGVGVGGTFEKCALMAKKALTRPVDEHSEIPYVRELEEELLSASDKRKSLEYTLFQELRSHMASQRERIVHAADMIAQLDYWQSLAQVGRTNNWCRPELDAEANLDIREGRHPVVEAMLGRANFVPNDFRLDDKRRLCLLTGPNMAGKSTVLRQVAIICLLAQMGAMVPATSARLGLVDRLFSRVGASDNLAQGQSTFMVEMMETARILRQATRRSLIILDEIGRGTSTFDGISIAWSVAEHLHNQASVKAKTLFATHYHELNEMAANFPRIQNANVAVREAEGRVHFLRKLTPGGTDRSFGIHVAQMAGMPGKVVALLAQPGRAVAKERLNELVFPGQSEVQYEAIEVVVYRLRKKLEQSGVQIVTVRGLGYCLEKPDVVA